MFMKLARITLATIVGLTMVVTIAAPQAQAKGKKKIVIEVDDDDDTTGQSTSSLGEMARGGRPGKAEDLESLPNAGVLYKLVPHLTAEQNIFNRFFERADYEKALFQWPSAFADTEFGESPTGRALSAYLFYKNGIKVDAMEMLLAIDAPKTVSPHVMKLWKAAATADDVNWTYVNPRLWKAAWTDVLGSDIEVRVRGHQTFAADQQKELQELIKKSKPDTVERAWLEWQAMLAQATGGDSAVAAKQLSALMKSPKNPVGHDLMTLTAARLLYQNGYLDAAIKYYNQVGKSSDDWFDAQEELAWAQLRKGEPQDAIATTKTLVVPQFSSLIGPEAVFVRSLAYLKVCDYPEVTKTLNVFRDQFRDRAKNMLEVADGGNTPAVQSFVERAKKEGHVKQIELGGNAAKLPRFISRDENLAHLISAEAEFENEGAQFKELYGRSLTGGSAKVGFQGRLELMRKDIETRVKSAKAASYYRVKALAQDELNEIAQTLQKMHVVEAEVLQQVALSGRVIGSTGDMKATERRGTTGSIARDRLSFPDDGETWFDELANYQVDLKKGCQSVTR